MFRRVSEPTEVADSIGNVKPDVERQYKGLLIVPTPC